MARDRAAYMREYRKRQRREQIMDTTMPAQAVRDLVETQDRVRELEAEVRHLKAQLAQRPSIVPSLTPAPTTPGYRKMTQAERDAVLRRISKG